MRAPRALLRTGAAALAATLLTACAVGPNFHRPAAPKASGYSPAPQPARTAGAPVPGGQSQRFALGQDIPGQWWALFRSPALDAIVREALAANPTLAAAQAALREAQAELHAGEGALLPALSANGSLERERLSGAAFGEPTLSPQFTLKSASLSVSYLMDLWGGTRRQIESLAAQADYQRFELEASYLTLTSNVVTAALQEASLRGQLGALQEIVDIEQQQLAGLRREFASGAAADTAVLAQAAALAQAQAQLVPLQKQLFQTRTQLTAYLGRLPSEELAATFDLAALQLPISLPVSVPSRLVEQRPDIRAAEAQLHVASAQVGVATANLLPQLSISGAYGSETLGQLLSPASMVWNIAASITQPLFEGGRLVYQRRAAVAAFQGAAAQYRQTVLNAFENVADALRALQLDAEELSAQAAADRAAADSLAASQRQYREGAASYLSLLTAEQAYQQSRLNLVEAQAARLIDTAALFEALGGGWWNRNDGATR